MFVLIWMTLLFYGASVGGRTYCLSDFCITLSEGEITAEAGLCVVIPCSFTTSYGFTPQHLVWYKCEPYKQRCVDSDIIFHTNNNNNKKIQSEFRGRVSLLEPDVNQRKCSIIINDLTESDSGSYQLRIIGFNQFGYTSGFTFSTRATVSVKGLTQKPTVMIPRLTEGQKATLTCTAPGLCSGSDPEITWTWRGAGEKYSHITGNIAAFKTEDLTAVTQRRSSTLTFNSSAEHHGTEVTCKVSFTNSITTEETVTLNVTYVKEVKITGNTSVKEGETLNLTCSVESFPPSLITWTKLGLNQNLNTGTETATFVILNVTAEYSGNYICTAKHLDNPLTKEVNITVIYVKEVKITGNTSVKEGETLTLTCSVESFPPSLITWTKFSDKNMQNGTETNLQSDALTDLHNDTETVLQEESGKGTISLSNVTKEDSGQYICTAKHLNNILMDKVDVTVIYMNKPLITGATTVKEGDALNLTCSVESFPPSHITWTVLGSNTNLHNEPDLALQNDTGSASLVIHNVTVEHSGQYICTAEHLGTTVTTYADVTVTWFSKILKGSKCEVRSEVLTCVCISEGFPLPTIKWPLLKNHAEYSVITTVSNHTVNSTATLIVKYHSNTSVECFSSNENGEAKENLTIQINTSQVEDQSKEVLKMVSRLEVIIAFFIGVLLSAVLCCLAIKCIRKKQKSFGNLDETLEMATGQEDPLIVADQAVEDDQIFYQETAEEGEECAAAEQAATDLNGGPKDVEYASIDFSVLKRKNPREAAKETTETEYAEIKKEVKEEREDNGGEEGDVLEGTEEEEVVFEEDDETEHCAPEEEEGEDMAVYSNVKDIMGGI